MHQPVISPIPGDHPNARIVPDFATLAGTRFRAGINALCWPRALGGDFEQIVSAIGPVDEIVTLDEDDLASLDLDPAGRLARETLVADLRRLRALNLDPSLDCIPAYPRDAEDSLVPTDVYSYHADRADAEADTWLCSYTTASSEGLAVADAIACPAVPSIRAALLQRYGGLDDAGFAAWLTDHFYDLHYVARPGALPYSFGFGHLWRITTAYPGCLVPPCVHRAPATLPGQPPRLLLIC